MGDIRQTLAQSRCVRVGGACGGWHGSRSSGCSCGVACGGRSDDAETLLSPSLLEGGEFVSVHLVLLH